MRAGRARRGGAWRPPRSALRGARSIENPRGKQGRHDIIRPMNTRAKRLAGACLCLVAGVMGEQIVMGQSTATAPAPPGLTFAFELRALVGPPVEVGQVPHGRRRIVPILGGTVKGPSFNATVEPGGADWQLIQP